MNLSDADWIWCNEQRPNTYCYARGRLKLPALPVKATLHIVADSRYQLWVNGAYIGQGPTPFRRPHVFSDTFDVTRELRAGDNVVAVLGNYHGVNHCTYIVGPPGILACLHVVDADANRHELGTSESWKVLTSEAYARDVPRRTWATAWCEDYDARREPAEWTQVSFDDAAWPNAVEVDQGAVKLFPRMTTPLEEYPANSVELVGVSRTVTGVRPLAGLTSWLDEEPLEPVAFMKDSEQDGASLRCVPDHQLDPNGTPLATVPVVIQPDERGVAFTVDFGKEIAGQIELEVEAPAGVVLDMAPAELLREGRPWCFRKGGEYARRYTTREGLQRWRCFGYDGMRYVHAVVRGPHPQVILHRLGVWQRQAALPIRAEFHSSDEAVNRIWDITCQTVRICSQDIHIDCPTREQTSAWGDHVWTGVWAAYMTGAASALRHLMLTAEHVQYPDGQLPCYAFSEVDPGPLFDYSLIAVWGVWLYYQLTGDRDLAERLTPMSDQVLSWYRKHVGSTGLIELDCDALHQARKGTLFIDHPGLGWHTSPTGIDRRGISAALNFLFIHALRAQAEVVAALGDSERSKCLREEAERVRDAAERLFYDSARGVYVDSFHDGRQSEQLSQQSNALAVTSGVCPHDRAPHVLARVLDPNDEKLCRCGTYFWGYLAEALCQSGMHKEMWCEVVRLWDDMAQRGATTWWETFLGDELDSLCHLWSSVPGYLILAEVLGVRPAKPGFAEIIIRPRFDLLCHVWGTVPIRNGQVSLEWCRTSERECCLTASSSSEATATIELPTGWTILQTGTARVSLPPGGRATFQAIRNNPSKERKVHNATA